MESSEKTRVIRQYKKSSIPRLRWTPDLHDHFVEAVHCLGGKYQATPKKIVQMMGVKGLKISHIKSHLQMYRSMRETAASNEFVAMRYHENRVNLRQFYEELREEPSHEKLVRVIPLTDQVRRVPQKGTNVIYHDCKSAQESSSSEITRGSANNGEANMKTQTHEIDFLGLDNHQSSCHINLELTIS